MSSSHQSKFPCIIITIIIILLFFLSFSTLLTVNLFVLFWRCFVMLNSYFVCFIIYIFFFNFEIFFVDIIFVPKIGVCFSFYPVSLIFEYEAKPHIRWPHIREYEAGESGANFTSVDLKSHGILCWPGKMAFCLEKSLKISGSHWKITCALLNLIWTWKHWLMYDKSVTLSLHLRPNWWNHACRHIQQSYLLHCCRYMNHLLHCSS